MSTKIKNLDTLEKEIYRLQLEARDQKDKLEKNLEYLQKHYASMAMNSFFQKNSSSKEKVKEKILNTIWENEKLRTGIDKIVDYVTEKATDGVESLLDKIFHRKN
jgi:hypothetical protein